MPFVVAECRRIAVLMKTILFPGNSAEQELKKKKFKKMEANKNEQLCTLYTTVYRIIIETHNFHL